MGIAGKERGRTDGSEAEFGGNKGGGGKSEVGSLGNVVDPYLEFIS